MPHTDTIPVSASIATTGKSIIYISEGFWAGWSGPVAIAQAGYSDLFNFNSPAIALLIRFEFGIFDSTMAAGEAVRLKILLNDLAVMERRIEYTGSGQSSSPSDLSTPFDMLIPPFTQVNYQASTDHSSAMNAYGVLTGRGV